MRKFFLCTSFLHNGQTTGRKEQSVSFKIQHRLHIAVTYPALFLNTTFLHVLHALLKPICCRFLRSAQPLLPVVSALLPPQYGTHSLLAFAFVRHHIHSVVFLKSTVSSRPSVPPSDSHKCLRFGLADTAHCKGFYLLT